MRKYKKIPKRNYRNEEYNNCTEKFNGGVQSQTESMGRINQQMQRQGSAINPVRETKRRMKKSEDNLKDYDTIKWTNIPIVRLPKGKEREKGRNLL